MKTHHIRMTALLLALVLLLAALSGCGSTGTKTPADTSDTFRDTQTPNTPDGTGTADSTVETATPVDTTLVVGVTDANGTHDPFANATSAYQIDTIFEKLLNIDPVTGELTEQLAQSVEYIDNTTIEIVLLDNVYFTDGQKLTAEDVLTCYRDVHAVGSSANLLASFDWEASCVVDERTLHFVLHENYGPAISILSKFYIYCAEDLFGGASDADKWLLSPNGTSPYYCTENISSSEVTYCRKDASQYWGELPACTQVTYRYYSESATMYIDFEGGALDAACNISSTDAQRVLNDDCPASTAYDINSLNDVLTLVLPEYTEALKDVRVREAIALAVDAGSVALASYGCLFREADSTLSPFMNYYAAQEPYPTDIERAKALMAEAGYADGLELSLVITQDNQLIAEALQGCLSQIGITLTIGSYAPPTAIPMISGGETDLSLKQSKDAFTVPDPALAYETIGPASTNASLRQTDETFSEAYYRGLNSTDKATRSAAYADCQAYLHDSYRAIPICERVSMLVYNSDKIEVFPIVSGNSPVTMDVVFR